MAEIIVNTLFYFKDKDTLNTRDFAILQFLVEKYVDAGLINQP